MKRKRWSNLTASLDFFDGCTKQPAEYIFAKDHERKIRFLSCESIAFQDNKGQDIWSTTGDGEINLPAGVGVYIVRGTWKTG